MEVQANNKVNRLEEEAPIIIYGFFLIALYS